MIIRPDEERKKAEGNCYEGNHCKCSYVIDSAASWGAFISIDQYSDPRMSKKTYHVKR